jgi:GTP pyrophosphokinase
MASETLEQPLTDRFTSALTYACELHRTQARKGTQIPYVAHLLSVAALVLEHGGSEDEAIGALLHDAVEDQGGPPTAAAIRERFGTTVAGIVAETSDTDQVPKPPWRERKLNYIAHVRSASPSARLVSAADKLHNARAILEDYRVHREDLWNRFNAGGKDNVLWYYDELLAAFESHGTTRLTGELRRVVEELHRLGGREMTARH